MGDRSMIVVKAEKFVTPIVFYGHWSGEQNIEAVKNVLARTGRIGDAGYLTAQLFWEFAKLGNYDGELSFGIDANGDTDDTWMDNPSVIVNADTGEYEVNGEVFTEFMETKV
jgi:hypothetical protein